MKSGAQGLHVKFHTGILYPIFRVGIGFQFAVMSGCHHTAPSFKEHIHDSHGQGRAFGGIGSRTEFIK